MSYRIGVSNVVVLTENHCDTQLDAIHDHLNEGAMDRITWIIIWSVDLSPTYAAGLCTPRLIVAACLVETVSCVVVSQDFTDIINCTTGRSSCPSCRTCNDSTSGTYTYTGSRHNRQYDSRASHMDTTADSKDRKVVCTDTSWIIFFTVWSVT